MNCKRYYVAGQVQGVFFRASAREKALSLGVDGYARNLPDGRVEILAAGPDDALAKLEDWLAEGPPQAQVERVEREEAVERPDNGFRVC